MKVLIVKTSSMGDVIHTLQAVEDIGVYRPEDSLPEFLFRAGAVFGPAVGRGRPPA